MFDTEIRHARGSDTKPCSHAPFAFKDSVIIDSAIHTTISLFAAFFNEIESQVIHRDTLYEPGSSDTAPVG